MRPVRPFAVTLALLAVAAACAQPPRPAAQPPSEPAEPAAASTGADELLPAPPEAPASVPEPRRIDRMEVGVAVAADSVRFEALGEAEVRGLPELRRLARGRSFLARAAGGRVLVQPLGERDLAVWEVTDTLRILPTSGATLVSVNGKRYRGSLEIFRSSAGKVTAVNVVGVEDYLRGVLPHEIGRLEERTLEAGKAQAVAARTYAIAYLGRRAALGFDVYDTVEDQVYGGVSDEGALTDRCVRETRGIVGLFGRRPIRANYFSTCGGVTANVEDVWPDPPLAWLRSVPDRPVRGGDDFCLISSQYRWSEIWGVDEFLEIVNRTYPTLFRPLPQAARELRDVRVVSRSASGRVARFVVETDVTTMVVRGDSVRRLLLRPKRSTGAGGGGNILRSALFKIALVKDARGRPLAVLASGAGYGHGVGMCQMGALGMARQGYDFEQILRHYYAGIALERLEG